jgi:hypothetical protein
MSHFTVLVIGPNPEGQLAPFHEFECTGHDDQYVQEVDITHEIRLQMNRGKSLMEALKYHGYEDRIVTHGQLIDRSGKHKYAYVVVSDDGILQKAVRRTNPNAKWDWYSLGGRWTGYFKLKNGAHGETGEPGLMTDPAKRGWCDAAKKSAIDFEGMRTAAAEEARERYRHFHQLVGDAPASRPWTEVLKQFPNDIDKAREVYAEQEVIKRLRGSNDFFFEERPERYFVTEDEFARHAAETALSTFAVVKDGRWFARGKMGWWAVVSDEKAAGEWEAEFGKLLDSIPQDTLLSVYDCHI